MRSPTISGTSSVPSAPNGIGIPEIAAGHLKTPIAFTETGGGTDLLGGMGYSAETDMQRYWRDARLLRIGPISNEMARNMIAEGLGLPRSF